MFLQIKQSHLTQKIDRLAGQILDTIGMKPSDGWDRLLILLAIILLCYLSYLLLSRLIVPLIRTLIKRSGSKFGIHFFQRHFLKRVMSMIPPVIALILLPLAFTPPYEEVYAFFQKLIYIFLLIMAGRMLSAGLNALYEYFQDKDQAATAPYKSLLEMAKLSCWGVLTLFMISILMSISPLHIITGLSAFAAILILVFRDTLLGFVAGIQLAYNRMVKIGDWIVVPGSDADGVVVDINILTLQVQNFDNTYVYIPAYNLVTNPFKNWAGMTLSGEWRVNEAIQIDARSVLMPDEAWWEALIANARVKILIGDTGFAAFQAEKSKGGVNFDTNLGVFRVWLKYYLAANPDVTPKPYQLIRENLLNAMGIPLELNFFINTNNWLAGYEKQAQVLEVMLGMLPAFGLYIFELEGTPPSTSTPASTPVS